MTKFTCNVFCSAVHLDETFNQHRGNKQSELSKAEYVGYKLARLSVEKSEWEVKKDAADLDAKEQKIKIEMLSLKNEAQSKVSSSSPNNSLCYRKRRSEMASSVDNKKVKVADPSVPSGNPRSVIVAVVETRHGKWNPHAKFPKRVNRKPFV